MDKNRVSQIREQFDLVIQTDETATVEFWYARELMPLLGYERWENFDKAVARAMDSCETSGIEQRASAVLLPHHARMRQISKSKFKSGGFCYENDPYAHPRSSRGNSGGISAGL